MSIERINGWASAPCIYGCKIGLNGPVPSETGMTNLQVLALLIAKNAFNTVVTGWGSFSGPFGLTMQDGVALLQLGSYLQGMIDCSGVGQKFVDGLLGPELVRLDAEFCKAEFGLDAEPSDDANEVTPAS